MDGRKESGAGYLVHNGAGLVWEGREVDNFSFLRLIVRAFRWRGQDGKVNGAVRFYPSPESTDKVAVMVLYPIPMKAVRASKPQAIGPLCAEARGDGGEPSAVSRLADMRL